MSISGLLFIKTQFITQIPTLIAQTVCGLSLNCSNGLQKFPTIRSQNPVPSFGTDQTAPHGFNQLKHHKTLKQRGKTSRIKPLPHGVCRNSLKSVPTRSPCCVEPLCFLLRRNPTVGLAKILERSLSLSLSRIKNSSYCKSFWFSLMFWSQFEDRR